MLVWEMLVRLEAAPRGEPMAAYVEDRQLQAAPRRVWEAGVPSPGRGS